jgi:DNA-binding transcriptional ArsR family regulator
VINELTIHFGDFNPPRSTQLKIDRLVGNLERESESLPLIVFDYPSEVDISPFISLIAPVLQRLRAFTIVVLTPSQLSSITEETLDMFDKPEFLEGLTSQQIQQLSDNLVSRKAKEKWKIDTRLLDAIRETTGGTPRDVIRLLRDLTDERRGVGSQGTLKRIMNWRGGIAEDGSRDIIEENPQFSDNSTPEVLPDVTNNDVIEHNVEVDSFEIDDELVDDHKTDSRDAPNSFEYLVTPEEIAEEPENLELPEEISEDPDDLWEEEEDNGGHEQENARVPEKQGTLEDFVYEPGTEPPMFETGFGFNRLAARSRSAPSKPTTPDGTEIIDASNYQKHEPRKEESPTFSEPTENMGMGAIEDSSAPIDATVRSNSESRVMSTDSAYWSVEESSASTVPDLSENQFPEAPRAVFGIEDSPIEENMLEEEIPEPIVPQTTPRISISPKWDSDNPLDESKLGSLNEAEIMILEASAAREISPSDAELQARLEVGRPRLSQIYNELFRSGLLSVRKQGRKRLFRISEAAYSHFGG